MKKRISFCKTMIVFVLALVMAAGLALPGVSAVYGGESQGPPKAEIVTRTLEMTDSMQSELDTAAQLGFPTDLVGQETITGRQYASAYDLDIRYFTSNGILAARYLGDSTGHKTIINCEVGWCGGLISEYQYSERDGLYHAFSGGGAIQATDNDVRIEHCYLHDCGPFTNIVSIHADVEGETEFLIHDIHIANNLIERGGAAAHWADITASDIPQTHGYLSNYVFEDNIVLSTGMGWVNNLILNNEKIGMEGLYRSTVENVMSPSDNDNIIFRNNIFYIADHALVFLGDISWDGSHEVNAQPVFSGNTYIQFSSLPVYDKIYVEQYYAQGNDTLEALGDETGIMIALE